MGSFKIKKLPPGLFRCQLQFSCDGVPPVAFQINDVDLLKISEGELPSAFVRSTAGHIIGEVTGSPGEDAFLVRFEESEYRIPKDSVASYLPASVPAPTLGIVEERPGPRREKTRVFPRGREDASDDDLTSLRSGIF
ncbi:hypothetical protein AZH53_09935 [Methanomicrobiaceae archaeon CYW5]|uniref:hypothetical protein n=1 Tax=Methanovulcanius yangii TaxID=1789227 RepID=UPI0029CA8537|nr:hypothetical protein [Methanovulcanius yangii]MBT8508724.1 hypothetical protein [Methanovulcanius yangii]